MATLTDATPATVRLILETSLTDPELASFIASAKALLLSLGVDDADCHTDESLTALHQWLSAHMAYIREGRLSSEKMGDGAETTRHPGAALVGLQSTYYGQTALTLDCSGILAGTGKEAVTVWFFGGAG